MNILCDIIPVCILLATGGLFCNHLKKCLQYLVDRMTRLWAIISFLLLFLGVKGSECNYNTYGDVMEINPTGASKATATSDKLPYEGRE